MTCYNLTILVDHNIYLQMFYRMKEQDFKNQEMSPSTRNNSQEQKDNVTVLSNETLLLNGMTFGNEREHHVLRTSWVHDDEDRRQEGFYHKP